MRKKFDNRCIASAGQIWIKLKQICIQVFKRIPAESCRSPKRSNGHQRIYLISDDPTKLELFLPDLPDQDFRAIKLSCSK